MYIVNHDQPHIIKYFLSLLCPSGSALFLKDVKIPEINKLSSGQQGDTKF